MFQIQGKYTTASVFAPEEDIDDALRTQIYDIVNSKAFAFQRVAVMPDASPGSSGVVGLSATISKFVNPSHIGVDAGCTISMMILDKPVPEEKYPEFEHRIRLDVPMGTDINEHSVVDEKEFFRYLSREFSKAKQYWPEYLSGLPSKVTEKWISEQLKRIRIDEATFYKSLNSLGGGNHMLEYGEAVSPETGEVVPGFTVHTGSRNFGTKMCRYWEGVAAMPITKQRQAEIKEDVSRTFFGNKKELKAEIARRIEEEKSTHITGYLSGENLMAYLCDLCFAQCYAKYNHELIQESVEDILLKYGIKTVRKIFTMHNYIDLENKVLHKSSIRSGKGEEILVAFNMRDGVALCEGLGNTDWLESCAHGSGRKMSRNQAKQHISVDDFKETMKDVYSTSVGYGTIDESPMAYKDTEQIKKLISETCRIVSVFKPKINIKATNERK